jgi:glutamate receptor, ionotropic, invertebrate
MWWFFALIMLASYTANLAAFLTTDRMTATISSAEDLVKSKVSYGAFAGGSTRKFFKESNFSTYSRMGTFMEANQSLFTDGNKAGADRVMEGNYAFLMESIPMEYITIKNCKLQRVGDLLDSKGYGIALPMGMNMKINLNNY